MPEDILVVEYEPRYTDRVKQALSGQPFTPFFAKDGEEALRALSSADLGLIVLSSVIPKISTNELIRKIRESSSHRTTPILLTVSGYSGKSTVADAGKIGANDILPKPYSESEFLGKVTALMRGNATAPAAAPPDFQARPVAPPAQEGGLTSSEIFGDLLDEDKSPARKKGSSADDLDKMLSETLSGLRAPKARPAAAPPAAAGPKPAEPARAAAPAAAAKPRPASAELDKLLDQTLSGLNVKRTGESPRPEPAKPEPPKPAAPAPVAPPPPTVLSTAATQKIAPVAAPPPVVEEESEDGLNFGQYVLKERIASGGMAEVWKARMRGVEGFQKTVAIKKILPHLSDNAEFIEMFIDEAKLAAQLNHNNIIHIYDLGKVAGSYFIAMEFIDGHDLKSILQRGAERGQPIPIELALLIASKLAAALDYAHRKRDFEEREMGLVHRDVSPQNVLISYEGDIKLCDFGIAKAASKASHTQAGALKGKLQYMSPEQAWGKKIDRRSDIFALSAVLYEMLTGEKLFSGDSEISVLERVREARVAAPSSINDESTPEIDKIVLKALAKEPENRYQTAGEMAKDLDQVLYSFRPTPSSADLAIYMHRLYSEDEQTVIAPAPPRLVEEPKQERENLLAVPDVIEIPTRTVEIRDEAPARPAAVAAEPLAVTPDEPAIEAPRMFGAEEEREKKKLPVVPIAAAVVALLAIGGFFALRGRDAAPAAATAPPAAQTALTATTASAAPVETEVVTASPAGTTIAPTDTVLASNDQALIDQEVQRRLAAEKARLDQQRAQQLAQQQAAAQTAAAPASPQVATPTQPQPQAPAAAAPAPTPAATVAETRPEPPPQVITENSPPAQQASVREGDLVDPGIAGLVMPELIRMKEPNYPPLARSRRIQGEVLLNALVSETGRVLEVRVVRSVNPDLGFGAAAADAVRGASFRPATKDGVRVKTYKTIKVSFKL